MNVTQALYKATERLSAYLVSDINGAQEAQWLLAHILHCSVTMLHAQHSRLLTAHEQQQLCSALDERTEHHKPLAYILESIPFCDITMRITPPILIPRPETEELTTWLINQIKKENPKQLRILDLCCGSGCIGLAIAQACPFVTVKGIDINPQAIALAQENACNLQLQNISFQESNLFSALATEHFDLIVSNPPYINKKEAETLHPSVLEWEDPQALFAEEDGLALYRRIAEESKAFLSVQTAAILPSLVVEIGYAQKKAVMSLFKQNAFINITAYKDMSGNERWITASRSPH